MAPPVYLTPSAAAQAKDTTASTEAELVEQIALSRQNYKEGLERLADYYTKNGNNMKLSWAKDELKALNTSPQYRFLIQAEVAGAELRATASAPGADVLYRDGMAYFSAGKPILATLAMNEGKLRLAIDRFNQVSRSIQQATR